METSAERELRAYVDLHEVGADILSFSPNIILEAPVKLLNSGKTPARDVFALGNIDILPYPPPSPFPNTFPEQDVSRFTMAAGLRADSTIAAHRLFSAQELADVRRGTNLRMYGYGLITYIDVFGKHRRTTFRFMYGGSGDAKNTFIACPEGNSVE